MYRIIYTSTSKEMMDERDLQRILRSARTHNSANAITGMLIYHDGCFIQVLEGDQDAVEACYKRIERDPRHLNCIEMAREAVVSRIFTDWWMTYQHYGDLTSFQQKQFLSLQQLAQQAREGDLTGDTKINAILLAFLSGFRDLDIAS